SATYPILSAATSWRLKRCTDSIISVLCARTRFASAKNDLPSSVKLTSRFVRSRSRTPISSSRSLIWRVSEGCARRNFFALFVKLSVSATATKYRPPPLPLTVADSVSADRLWSDRVRCDPKPDLFVELRGNAQGKSKKEEGRSLAQLESLRDWATGIAAKISCSSRSRKV